MPTSRQFMKEFTRGKTLTYAASKRAHSHHSSKGKPNNARENTWTADDYLAEGVDLEEAGEKWRAGDAAKSARFFVRAVDAYDEALKKFPDSFDVAYNKARVQYDLTQYPKLAAQLPGSLLELYKKALESSRYALNLRQDNPDVLFNTAQVLTSLVEAVAEDRSGSISKDDGLRLLEEAIELFQRCLVLQEYQLAESQAQNEVSAPVHEPDKALNSTPQRSSEAARGDDLDSSVPLDETWAMIVEPVTNDTLLDTVLAQVQTLTTLCGLINADEGRGLAWIEEYSTDLLNNKLPVYVIGTDREGEAALRRSSFIAALADASFRSQRMDAATYERVLEEAFAPLDLSNDPEGLCEKAEALLSYSSSLDFKIRENSETKSIASSKWRALTAALDDLTAATRLPLADNLTKIHLMRGDVELLRYQLGQTPLMLGTAVRYSATLLKNAGTYYRGAENHGIAANIENEVKEATVKKALVAGLQGNLEILRDLMKVEPEASHRVLEEAVDDNLVGPEWLIKVGIIDQQTDRVNSTI